MKHFYVLLENFNPRSISKYDIIPDLVEKYKELGVDLKTFDEYKTFVLSTAEDIWFNMLDYDYIIAHPDPTVTNMLDIHEQVKMNIDVITNIFIDEINAEGVLVY